MLWYTKDTCISCKIILYIFSRDWSFVKTWTRYQTQGRILPEIKLLSTPTRERKQEVAFVIRGWQNSCCKILHPSQTCISSELTNINTALLGMSNHCHHTAHDLLLQLEGWDGVNSADKFSLLLAWYSDLCTTLPYSMLRFKFFFMLFSKNGTYEFRFC